MRCSKTTPDSCINPYWVPTESGIYTVAKCREGRVVCHGTAVMCRRLVSATACSAAPLLEGTWLVDTSSGRTSATAGQPAAGACKTPPSSGRTSATTGQPAVGAGKTAAASSRPSTIVGQPAAAANKGPASSSMTLSGARNNSSAPRKFMCLQRNRRSRNVTNPHMCVDRALCISIQMDAPPALPV